VSAKLESITFPKLIVVGLLFVFVLTATEGLASNASTIKIGALLDLSGPFSSFGTVAYRSIRLAVENINLQGGIGGCSLEIMVFDTMSDENRLIDGATQLKEQGAVALIGPSAAQNCLLIRKFAEDNRIPLMLVSGTSPVLTFSGIKTSWTFSSTLNFSSELKALFGVFQKRGYQNLGVLVQADSFYRELFLWIRGYAPEYGLGLGCAVGFNPNSTDISRKIDYINRCEPDIALVWANDQTRDMVQNALTSVEVPVALSHSLYEENIAWGANSTSSLLLFVAIPRALAPVGLKRSLSFSAKSFLNSWKGELESANFSLKLCAAQAWDGVMILSKALGAGGSKGRSQLRYALENSIRSYHGVIGKISYDKRDHSLVDPASLQVLRFFGGHWGFAK